MLGNGLDAADFWGFTNDPYIGSYGDNSSLYFFQYENAPAGSLLANQAKTGTNILALNRNPARLLDVFRQDVQTGNLAGFIYRRSRGIYSAPELGLGIRRMVHLAVLGYSDIQPGGLQQHRAVRHVGRKRRFLRPYSAAQVFDHTSLIRFIESRFSAVPREGNITPWRRAVARDLTSAFDFTTPNTPVHANLPDTSSFEPTNLVRFPDYPPDYPPGTPPSNQSLPVQEPGVRPARALPYTLNAHGLLQANGSFLIV